MLSIGEVARDARVSVRVLRHWDALGLVVPAEVDPRTGYRRYAASQLARVDAVVALKELGFTLAQCREVLDEVSGEELRAMLRRRRCELADAIASDTARLAEVDRRVRSVERGLTVTNGTMRLQPLPALRLARVAARVTDESEIASATGPLRERLVVALQGAGIVVEGLGVRTFDGYVDGGTAIEVAAGVVVGAEVVDVPGAEVVELAAHPQGAVFTFRGPPAGLADAWRTIDVATEEQGLVQDGTCRQLHLEGGQGDDEWVVELQVPVRPAGGPCAPPADAE